MAPKAEDLKPTGFPKDLSWKPEDTSESLGKLRAYSEGEAERAAAWYLKQRTGKRRVGQSLRGLTIGFTVGAGLIPILSQLFLDDGKPIIQPGWSALLLGLAGLAVSYDKFFGGTSSWLRYIAASQKIGGLLRKFRFDYETQISELGAQNLSPDLTRALIGRCRWLVAEVDRVVREETETWAAEFGSALTQMDQAAAKTTEIDEFGAIDLEVTNGDQVVGTWTLQVDSGSARQHTGKQVTIAGLTPGVYELAISGEIGGTLCSAKQDVPVSKGGIEAVSLTLA